MKLFNCKITCDKTQENGITKKVVEVKAVRQTYISEVFESEELGGDTWYKCKIAFTTLDEKSGNVKHKYANMMVVANTLDEALKILKAGLKDTMAACEVVKVENMRIEDVLLNSEEEV